MDKAQLLATVVGAGGGGAALLALVNGLIKWLSGASAREREKNTDLVSQRRRAIEERDEANEKLEVETTKRRQAEEHVAILKRQLILLGEEPEERTKENA